MKLSDYIAVALLRSAESALQEGNTTDVYLSPVEARSRARDILDVSFPAPDEAQLAAAFEQLLAVGLVDPFRTPHAAPRYRFNWDMIAEFSENTAQDDPAFGGALWAYRRLGLTWLRESFRAALDDPEAAEITSPESGGSIPAADRYVTLKDNRRDEVTGDLRELAERIRADNQAPDDVREIALSEISAFEAVIAQPRVSSELIDRFVRRILSWITKTFSEAIVSVAVEKLIEALLDLI